ncbi:FRG domain-containing protein [Pseudomonas frederiksbergensis]|uniref:FRG domain-containing protein n=1 Tax=Pseudomonas frederiksbergensis TaxID=104087 RepID=UPI003CFCFD73
MYHFFVTARSGAWDNGFYLYDRSRFLEYTNDKIAEAFSTLTESHMQTLLSWPCLFAYEGDEEDVRIGTLRSIKEQGRSLRIEFDLSSDIAPIPYANIKPIAPLLDIREWEMSRTHWAIKDEDLFARLRERGLLAADEAAGSEQTPPLVDELPEAPPSLMVSTVGEFIQQVFQVHSGMREVFYRGHSSRSRYKLEPSLFRKDAQGNYLYLDYEHTLYRELLVSNSIDFHEDNYTLDRLVRMQHYSLPTRLLDITSNPLIALYFACKSNLDTDGEVIILTVDREQIKYFDSDTASCLANLARLPKVDKDAIDHSIEDVDEFNYQLSLRRLVHFVREEKSFFEPRIKQEHLRTILCVKGKRSNSRITSQSGAFLLFGLDAILNESGTEEISVKRISISNKVEILRQLDLLNINESTVFPYIENSAKYVAQKYSFSGISNASIRSGSAE